MHLLHAPNEKKNIKFESWGTTVPIRGAMQIKETVYNLETNSSLKMKLTVDSIFPENQCYKSGFGEPFL